MIPLTSDDLEQLAFDTGATITISGARMRPSSKTPAKRPPPTRRRVWHEPTLAVQALRPDMGGRHPSPRRPPRGCAVSGAERLREAASLRGKCHEMAQAAVAADPALTLVRGWYCDPTWGREEHWWTTRPDGSIFDPTAAQFPMGGVAEWYEEFTGLYPCEHCGRETAEADLYLGMTCSGRCYGLMVGVLG